MTFARRTLLALALAGLALRPQLTAMGPLLPEIRTEFGMSHAIGGLLVALPLLCMGLLAPVAASVARRLGARRAIAGSLLLVAVAGSLRALVPSGELVLALTVPVGIGIGIAGTLLPVLSKLRLPERPGGATSTYISGVVIGSFLSSALAVALADLFGSFRGPVLLFGLATAVLGLLFAAMLGDDSPDRQLVARVAFPLRRPIAWILVALFGIQSLVFFGLATWLPATYLEYGWTAAQAGPLVGILIVAGLPVTGLLGWLGDRHGSRRGHILAGVTVTLVGLLGVIVAPGPGLLWTVLIGIGLGVFFPVAMTLPLDVSATPDEAGSYVGLMLGAGYSLSAVSPFVLGAVRDVVGTFSASLWLLVGAVLLLAAAAIVASPARLARERARSLAGRGSPVPAVP